VKWGPEVKAETFASRLAWAAGYIVEPAYYVASGRIRGVNHAGRAEKFLDDQGNFKDARFELVIPSNRYLQKAGWTWEKNPFLRTHQLNGLKIVVMLTSNWDNKDRSDPTTNTAIVRQGSGSTTRFAYLVTDWGASMGKWGNFFTREKWDCEGYAEQTAKFVRGTEDGHVRFGFSGKHDGDFKDDITISDVRWIMRYLGRVTTSQLGTGLRASGATAHEEQCFVRAINERITQLRRVAAL